MSGKNRGQTLIDLAILVAVICLFVSIGITTWENAASWLGRSEVVEASQGIGPAVAPSER